MLKIISFVNVNLMFTETPFLRLKSSSRLHSSTFGNYSLNNMLELCYKLLCQIDFFMLVWYNC